MTLKELRDITNQILDNAFDKEKSANLPVKMAFGQDLFDMKSINACYTGGELKYFTFVSSDEDFPIGI